MNAHLFHDDDYERSLSERTDDEVRLDAYLAALEFEAEAAGVEFDVRAAWQQLWAERHP